jgi:hypothetical protein
MKNEIYNLTIHIGDRGIGNSHGAEGKGENILFETKSANQYSLEKLGVE